MLPLLPALLLLLLQGPSNIERLAQAGRLPEALDSLHRQIFVSPAAADLAMTSLLQMSGDESLAQALATLLGSSEAPPQTPATPARVEEIGAPAPVDRSAIATDEGYSENRRTRDGP